jgi:hypothetical protein
MVSPCSGDKAAMLLVQKQESEYEDNQRQE